MRMRHSHWTYIRLEFLHILLWVALVHIIDPFIMKCVALGRVRRRRAIPASLNARFLKHVLDRGFPVRPVRELRQANITKELCNPLNDLWIMSLRWNSKGRDQLVRVDSDDQDVQ